MAVRWPPDYRIRDYNGPYPLHQLEQARRTLIDSLRWPIGEILQKLKPVIGISSDYGPALLPPPLPRRLVEQIRPDLNREAIRDDVRSRYNSSSLASRCGQSNPVYSPYNSITRTNKYGRSNEIFDGVPPEHSRIPVLINSVRQDYSPEENSDTHVNSFSSPPSPPQIEQSRVMSPRELQYDTPRPVPVISSRNYINSPTSTIQSPNSSFNESSYHLDLLFNDSSQDVSNVTTVTRPRSPSVAPSKPVYVSPNNRNAVPSMEPTSPSVSSSEPVYISPNNRNNVPNNEPTSPSVSSSESVYASSSNRATVPNAGPISPSVSSCRPVYASPNSGNSFIPIQQTESKTSTPREPPRVSSICAPQDESSKQEPAFYSGISNTWQSSAKKRNLDGIYYHDSVKRQKKVMAKTTNETNQPVDTSIEAHEAYKCDHCFHMTTVPSLMKVHLQNSQHPSASLYMVCNDDYTVRTLSVRHMFALRNDVTATKPTQVRIIVCPECFSIFNDIFTCGLHHYYTHGGGGEYAFCSVVASKPIHVSRSRCCLHCNTMFKLEENLRLHWTVQPLHNPATPPARSDAMSLFTCSTCLETFATNFSECKAHVITAHAGDDSDARDKACIKMDHVIMPSRCDTLPKINGNCDDINGVHFEINVLQKMQQQFKNDNTKQSSNILVTVRLKELERLIATQN